METKQIAIGLIWRGQQLVVGRRAENQVLGGYDEFPGGKCEPGETPAAAVIRECREETGLDVEVISLRLEQEHDYSHARVHLSFFDCRPADEHALPTVNFHYTLVEEVLNLHFPPANGPLLETIRRDPHPMVRPVHSTDHPE